MVYKTVESLITELINSYVNAFSLFDTITLHG